MESGEPCEFPELNTQSDITLEQPDLYQMRQDRLERNKAIMQAVSPAFTARVLHEDHQGGQSQTSPEVSAALCIQKWYRGFRGRKIYAEKLFEQFEKEEAEQKEKMRKQMEEGELLVEKIQRAWRAYLERKHAKEATLMHVKNSDLELQQAVSSRLLEDKNASKKENSSVSDEKTDRKLVENSESFKSNSELIFQNPLIDFEKYDINVGQSQVSLTQQTPEREVKFKRSEIQRIPCESDEDYERRLKKHNFLQDAHRFVELKKVDANILPFDLHKFSHLGNKNNSNIVGRTEESDRFPGSESSCQNMSEILSQSKESFASAVNEGSCDNSDNIKALCDTGDELTGIKGNIRTRECDTKSDFRDNSQLSGDGGSSADQMIDSGIQIEADIDNSNGSKGSKTDEEEIGPFEVYNIETALPNINWETLEESLRKASEEEKLRQEARRNDREEIRKKLAMGFDDDDDFDNDNDNDEEETSVYKKPTLQSRLQSGMNLQICFMNESPADTDSDHGRSPRQFEEQDNMKILPKVGDIVDSDNNLPSVADLNRVKLDPSDRGEASNTTRLKSDVNQTENQDFHSRQEQLQNEAKLALAQAGTMARMQLEVEKQTRKKSPMAEMVGIPGLGERRRKKLGLRKLQEMNLAQIQVLYNDLQTQIESLNEELVQLLMERDELHMEQDSMLVDVEDLTRRAEEIAEKATKTTRPKETTTCNSKLKGKLLGR